MVEIICKMDKQGDSVLGLGFLIGQRWQRSNFVLCLQAEKYSVLYICSSFLYKDAEVIGGGFAFKGAYPV